MFNKKMKEDKMESLKLEIIRKIMMLDTKEELKLVKEYVSDAICREMDLDDKEQDEFKKWKSNLSSKDIANNEVVDDITI
tara:strand:- start:282 stop:521 length:240 start_codon:yes stop_codon:yes gene_type:complete